MPGAPMPPNEATRLAALQDLQILDSPPDEEFDAIVKIASAVAGTPISVIALIDAERQWMKARIGLTGEAETARGQAFCAHTILGTQLFEVYDAACDERFAGYDCVTGEPNLRFYAGAPLRLADGSNVGALCVIDRRPRQLDSTQRDTLMNLARLTAHALESWRARKLQAATAQALRESEDRLRRLYESTPAMLHSTDHEGRLLTVSDSWLARLGYRRDEVIGRKAVDFLTAESRDYDQAIVLPNLLTSGRNDEVEFQAVARDGSILDVLLSSRMERDAEGHITRGVAVVEEVTRRRAAERALARSNERLEMAAESGGIGVWEWHVEQDSMVWDARMRSLYGVEAGDLRGAREIWRSRLHPADRERAERAVGATLEQDVCYEDEFRVIWPDQSVHWIKAFGQLHSSRPGQPRRMVGVNWDITQHRRLAAELAEQHGLLQITLQSIADGVITTGSDGRIVWLNPAAERLTGWPSAQAAGQMLTDVFRTIDEATRLALPDPVASCLAEPAPCGPAQAACRALLVSREGCDIGVEVSAAPIASPAGDILGSVLVFHDVTQQRQAAEQAVRERELRVANVELDRLAQHFDKARSIAEQASRAKTRFLAGMSHELRTPLNGILGYAQLLRMDGGLTATQGERVDAMLTAGRHLLEMISCVLDLSEIESGSTELQTAQVDVRGLARATLNIVLPAAQSKALRLGLIVDPAVPLEVMTDGSRLRQVLLNLLGNAVKFTGTGAVELHVSCSAPQSGTPLLRFEVADTGPGIPVAQRHLLFEEFERLDAAAAGQVEGSGLGLALSRRLASLLGGSLGHGDNPGGGSVFWLELPWTSADATPMAAASPQAQVPGHRSAPACRETAPRILVVDDLAMNRDIAAAFLRAGGYEAICAEGGAAAITEAAAGDFDAVLMDVSMPEIDGLEATRRIRALPGHRGRVPIIALTAQVFTEQIEACRSAGMDWHVAKPFTPETLASAIRQGIDAAAARGGFAVAVAAAREAALS